MSVAIIIRLDDDREAAIKNYLNEVGDEYEGVISEEDVTAELQLWVNELFLKDDNALSHHYKLVTK